MHVTLTPCKMLSYPEGLGDLRPDRCCRACYRSQNHSSNNNTVQGQLDAMAGSSIRQCQLLDFDSETLRWQGSWLVHDKRNTAIKPAIRGHLNGVTHLGAVRIMVNLQPAELVPPLRTVSRGQLPKDFLCGQSLAMLLTGVCHHDSLLPQCPQEHA